MSTPKKIDIPDTAELSKPAFQKMLFIANALEQGWTVKKSQESYIFTNNFFPAQFFFGRTF